MSNKDILLKNTKNLICTYGFDKVTVKMICEKSSISRKAFYSFYHDKYEILEEILIRDFVDEINDLFSKFGRIELNRSIILEALYQRIYDNGEFYRKMINTDNKYILEKYLFKYMIELMKKILTGAKIEDKEKEYAIYFYASAQVTLIRKWILDNYEISPKQLATYYKKWAVKAMCDCYLPREIFCI
ncbi:MAG: TetR/AcrR family transcriptional regulator [Thomasclavelia sp.]|uniref:TetR/AcrR family transcriptional regulator n=1 Tax=Thomasclavelia sp. TaxID=3025757 RepID=UPI00399F063D